MCLQLEFTTPSTKTPPTICGHNIGQHMYVDSSVRLTNTNPSMQFTFTGEINLWCTFNINLSKILPLIVTGRFELIRFYVESFTLLHKVVYNTLQVRCFNCLNSCL